jgi:DNA-directed RNA polymerase specialized sigma24 family protein
VSLHRTWLGVATGKKQRPLPRPFDPRGPYGGTVATYAQRGCQEQWRSEHKQTDLPSVGGADTPEVVDGATDFDLASERDARKWWLKMMLMATFQALPEGQRDVAVIRWAEMLDSGIKLSSATIAEVLGKSTQAVDMAYYHACQSLLALGIDLKAAEELCRRQPPEERKDDERRREA